MNETRLRMAMVALREPRLPDPQALTALHAEHWPDVAALVSEHTDPSTGVISFRTAGAHFALALMPSPIPWSELSGPAESAWHWPEAAARLKRHQAHLIVTASSSTLDAIDLMLALTRVVAVAALSTPAAGIYWAGARQVHDVSAFVDEADTASREQLPLYLWLRFGLLGEDDGSTTLHTTGLAELEHMELEFPHSAFDPQTLVDRAFNIAHYLLDHGPVLAHGHTIGISAAERLNISHAPSMFDPARQVYSLTLSGGSPPTMLS